MAKKTVIVDDFDGTAGATTVSFSFEGNAYEVDLSDKNLKAFEKAIMPYVEASRRTAGRRRRTSTAPAKRARNRAGRPVDSAAVREWAAAQGIEVSSRGRVAAEVIEQYRAAQG
jgi:hypothetical protein